MAGTDDDLLRQYPISEQLIEKRNDPGFLEVCRTLIIEIHSIVRAAIDHKCRRPGLGFDEIVITVPVNWGDAFQKAYLAVIRKVYNDVCTESMDNVHVIAESDAAMHYMLEHCVGGENRIDEDWNMLLFLDFGGHSMVSNFPDG